MHQVQVSVGSRERRGRVRHGARARAPVAAHAARVLVVAMSLFASAVRAAVPTVPASTTLAVTEGSRTTVTFPGTDDDGHAMDVLIISVASLGTTYADAQNTALPAASVVACNPDVTARVLTGQTTMSYAAPCVNSPTETTYSTTVTYKLRDSTGLCSAQSTLTLTINVYDAALSRFLRACSAKWTSRTEDVSTVDAVDWWSNPSLPLSAADSAGNGYFPKVVDSSAVAYGWGDNSVSQLALGHTSPTVLPETNTRFEEVKQFTYIAAAEKMVFGIEHGTGYVWGWGYDVAGALGLQKTGSGAMTVTKVPVRIGELTSIIKLAVGEKHAAAVSSKGYVYTWGADGEGQLGRGWTPGALQYVHSEAFAQNKSLPARVVNNGFRTLVISEVAAGSSHTLALTSTGDIWVWGSNLDAQLGLKPCEVSRYGDGFGGCSSFPNAPEMAYTDSPMYLPLSYDGSGTSLIGGIKFKAISANARYSMAITADEQTDVVGGKLYTWGLGETGQLGHGSTGSSLHPDPRRVAAPRPVEALSGLNIIFATAGEFHAAALSADGNLYTWGLNTYGQLGHNDRVNRYSPVLVSALADANVNISWVSCGRSHTVAVSDFGEVFTWGSNEFGQLGLAARPAEDAAYTLSLTLRGWKQTAVGSRRRSLLATDTSTYSVLFNDFTETPDLSGGIGAAHASFQAAVMGAARPYSDGYLAIADIGLYGEVEYVASPVIVEGIQQVTMAVAAGGSSLALRISCNVGSERDTDSGSCVECMAGYFTNDFTSFTCTACPKGQYQDKTGTSSCALCPKGSYAETVARESCTGCSPGTFLPFLGTTSASLCENCPAGSYSDSSGSSECKPCVAGTYQVTTGQSTCTKCDEGSFNPTNGASRATACLKCPAGSFANITGMSACSPCAAGFYAAGTGSTACTECPLGTYSPGGLSECIACPRGTIGDPNSVMASVDDCVSCQPGFYMPSSGQAACLECPNGSYSDTTGASACIQCPAGYVGNGVITTRSSLAAACQECQIGTYTATQGSVAVNGQFCTLCEVGTYQDVAAQTSCKPCPAGKFGANAGSSSVDDCQQCAAGKYAEFTGMSACIDCAPGTYGPANRDDTSECIACGAGTYSIEYGAAAADDCNECQAGYFAIAGQACQKCEPGTYQDETRQDQCKLCPAGTFLTEEGATAESQCEKCPIGTFTLAAGSTECTPCPEGSYSDTPGAAECSLCPVGTELPIPGSTSAADCQDCPAGSVSTAEGTANCALCAPGTFSTVTKASECEACPEGSYNPAEGSTSSDACLLCTYGSFADTAGSAECTQCLEGTYGDELGMVQCKPAPAGSFLAGTGATSADNIEKCALGSFSESEGSAACTNCAAGTYGAEVGLTSCQDCPAGTFSVVEGSDSSDNCEDCQIGTYSIPGAVACTQCPAGTYGNVVGLEQCIGCPKGKYGTAIGARNETSCLSCEEGTYSDTEGTQQCTLCPAGKYADVKGLQICKNCAPGTYGSVEGAKIGDETVCFPCPLGTASSGGLSACPFCSPGTYAELEGLQNCKLCPAGTYGVETGAKAAIRCDRCPLYRFNSTPGSSSIEACVYYHSATGRAFTTIPFVIAFVIAYILCV